MSLPIKISPCPITHTVVELRFKPSVPTSAIFGLLYQSLAKEFPTSHTSPLASIPPEARKQNPVLALQPLHILESSDLAIGIGEQNITFSMKGEYPGWDSISAKFAKTVKQVLDAKIIEIPSRFSLRYINFFPGDVFNNFTLDLTIRGDPIQGPSTFVQAVIQAGEYNLLLKVAKDMDVVKDNKTSKGCIIDIDAYIQNIDDKQSIDSTFNSFLKEAHDQEKTLFYRLLKDDFLKTLNPIYA